MGKPIQHDLRKMVNEIGTDLVLLLGDDAQEPEGQEGIPTRPPRRAQPLQPQEADA